MVGLTHFTYSVLNTVYNDHGQVQLSCVEGYVELLARHHHLHIWLLPPSVAGLAAARSRLVQLTKGLGAVIIMDDDAQRFTLTERGSVGGLGGRTISFEELVRRLQLVRCANHATFAARQRTIGFFSAHVGFLSVRSQLR